MGGRVVCGTPGRVGSMRGGSCTDARPEWGCRGSARGGSSGCRCGACDWGWSRPCAEVDGSRAAVGRGKRSTLHKRPSVLTSLPGRKRPLSREGRWAARRGDSRIILNLPLVLCLCAVIEYLEQSEQHDGRWIQRTSIYPCIPNTQGKVRELKRIE